LGKEKKKGGELSEFFKRELSAKMGDDYNFGVCWLGFIFGGKKRRESGANFIRGTFLGYL